MTPKLHLNNAVKMTDERIILQLPYTRAELDRVVTKFAYGRSQVAARFQFALLHTIAFIRFPVEAAWYVSHQTQTYFLAGIEVILLPSNFE